jgi:hypothetical protein
MIRLETEESVEPEFPITEEETADWPIAVLLDKRVEAETNEMAEFEVAMMELWDEIRITEEHTVKIDEVVPDAAINTEDGPLAEMLT